MKIFKFTVLNSLALPTIIIPIKSLHVSINL